MQVNRKQAIKRTFDVNRMYVKNKTTKEIRQVAVIVDIIVNITVTFCPIENCYFIGAME